MQEVFGFQEAGGSEDVEIGDAVGQGALAVFLEAEVTDAEGVEDGGDARHSALCVMRQEGGARGPARAGPWLNLTLEVVGMEIDDARDEEVTLEVDAARARAAFVEGGDQFSSYG